MRVHWTDTAQAHLDAIHAYIAQDSAEYATHTIDRLTRIFHVFYMKYPLGRLRRARRSVLAQDYPFGASKGYLEPFDRLRVPSEVEGQGVFYAAPKLWLQVVVAKAHISHAAAAREICGLTRRSQQISEFPLSGRRVPEYDIDQVREVIEAPYRIIYHIKPDQIDILAVIHGSMNILSSENKSD